jgi:hypothetical protein
LHAYFTCEGTYNRSLFIQVAMCNFQTIKDAADVAIATMLSGIQVCPFPSVFPLLQLPFENILKADMKVLISFVPYRVNVHVSMLMFVHVTTVV